MHSRAKSPSSPLTRIPCVLYLFLFRVFGSEGVPDAPTRERECGVIKIRIGVMELPNRSAVDSLRPKDSFFRICQQYLRDTTRNVVIAVISRVVEKEGANAMQSSDDAPLVTSDEFVTDLVCELALRKVPTLTLADTMTDDRFEAAFVDLLNAKSDLGIDVDFSLMVNPYHGDSSTLRETLYDLRERGVVSINNPSFKTVGITVDEDGAEHFLKRSSLPKDFIAMLIDKHFVDGGAEVEQRPGTFASA